MYDYENNIKNTRYDNAQLQNEQRFDYRGTNSVKSYNSNVAT